jgi:hypothetical protein
MVYIYNFILFKFLQDILTLILYTLLDASILNSNLSFEMNSVYFVK